MYAKALICGSARPAGDLSFFQSRGRLPSLFGRHSSLQILAAKPSLSRSFADSEMARIAVTVSVIFFLFVFAQAYKPTEDFLRSDSWVLTESDPEGAAASRTILLPSEKPKGKIVSNFEWKADVNSERLPDSEVTIGKLPENEGKEAITPELESEIDGAKLPEPEVFEPAEESESNVESVPLTVVTFRPINRHFQRMHDRRPFPFRMPHRCRHHFKPIGPRFLHREIPFGNDMIMARDDDAPTNIGPVFRGGRLRHHPARWVKLHHRGPKIPLGHEGLSRDDFKTTYPHVEGEDMERGPGEQEQGGLFKGFRKFLNGF